MTMENLAGIAVFTAIMIVIGFVSFVLFVLRAEKVRRTGKTKRDVRMVVFLVLAFGFLIAFSASLREVTDAGIAATISSGLIGLLGLTAVYEIYGVLASPPSRRLPSKSAHTWRVIVYLGASLMVVSFVILVAYGTPNFSAVTIFGVGLLLACYSFFSWLNERLLRRMQETP